jgi:KaiC/GvpD/RAD55 family RecA-like ATPase
MSRDDVLKQLKELGLTGEFKKEGNQTIIQVEEKSDSTEPKDITPVESEDSEGQEKV